MTEGRGADDDEEGVGGRWDVPPCEAGEGMLAVRRSRGASESEATVYGGRGRRRGKRGKRERGGRGRSQAGSGAGKGIATAVGGTGMVRGCA